MSDSEEALVRAQPKTALARSDYDLRGCFGRHRALASTWSVFPALGIASEDHYISSAITSLRNELEGYAEISPIRHDESALPKVISCIDSLEHCKESVAVKRHTTPGSQPNVRQSRR